MNNQRDFHLISSNDTVARPSYDFNKMKIDGTIYKNDVILTSHLHDYKKIHVKKEDVMRALERRDVAKLRDYSNIFFTLSGIYSRLCRYVAYIYRYDWMVTPIILDNKISDNKVIEGWMKSVSLLDESKLKRLFGEIALKVVRNGSYYGYKITSKTASFLQELPVAYCRSRYNLNATRIVEFNVKYFDDKFSDTEQRIKILKMFPKEIQQGYVKYKKGTLQVDARGETKGWVALDPAATVKFNLNNSDIPLFVSIIPKLIDLEDAQDLDKKRMEQQLIRLIIQQMPIDKNGVLVFDVDEAAQLHKNAVQMVGEAVGVDVLTTFADVEVADLSDKSNMSAADQLDKVERTVYNEAGVSQMQFNTSGNLALEKSIANDEATMTDLLLQFEEYAESLLAPFNKNPKRLRYKVNMLPTTIYNYKDLSKIYKEQTQIGFSKLLPQIALGQSPSVVLSTALFENGIMHLDEVFTPPQMSSTVTNKDKSDTGGRPELPDDEKSEKTIKNRESMT